MYHTRAFAAALSEGDEELAQRLRHLLQPAEHNNNGGYNNGGYNNGGYNSGGYNSCGSNSGGYNSGGYNSGGYNSGSYNSGGYPSARPGRRSADPALPPLAVPSHVSIGDLFVWSTGDEATSLHWHGATCGAAAHRSPTMAELSLPACQTCIRASIEAEARDVHALHRTSHDVSHESGVSHESVPRVPRARAEFALLHALIEFPPLRGCLNGGAVPAMSSPARRWLLQHVASMSAAGVDEIWASAEAERPSLLDEWPELALLKIADGASASAIAEMIAADTAEVRPSRRISRRISR